MNLDCSASRSESLRHAYAYALDANGDSRTDFIREAAMGIEKFEDGPVGICGAVGWPRLFLWVSTAKGRYREVYMEYVFTVLKSPRHVLFTHQCGGDMTNPHVQLAAIHKDRPRLTPFGPCYASIEDAEAVAASWGYRRVDLR